MGRLQRPVCVLGHPRQNERRRDRFPGLSPRAHCLVVDDDGMRPRFCSGHVPVIDPDRLPKQGDHVVIWGVRLA